MRRAIGQNTCYPFYRRIEEQGTYAELIARDGRLFRLQAAGYGA